MKIKEKCIYYNRTKCCYYLVLCVSDMIYGRYGEMLNPSYLDNYMHQDGTGLRFKIDDIVINMDYYRNYYLDDNEINNFELVKELSDEEFYPMDLLIESNCRFPNILINVQSHIDSVSEIVSLLRKKKSELQDLQKEIRKLEKELYQKMKK